MIFMRQPGYDSFKSLMKNNNVDRSLIKLPYSNKNEFHNKTQTQPKWFDFWRETTLKLTFIHQLKQRK